MEKVGSLEHLVEKLEGEGQHAFPFNFGSVGSSGMTLRDYFAAQAIGPMLDTADVPVSGWAEYVASGAYHIADAMLNERESPRAPIDLARENMAQVLATVLDEVGDGTGRTSVDSFLPQALVDRIEKTLAGGSSA